MDGAEGEIRLQDNRPAKRDPKSSRGMVINRRPKKRTKSRAHPLPAAHAVTSNANGNLF